MHKKSIEAAHKLNEDDDDSQENPDIMGITDVTTGLPGNMSQNGCQPGGKNPSGLIVDKEELRSESIAALRAKAQTYSAKIRQAMGSEGAGAGHTGNGSASEQTSRDCADSTVGASDCGGGSKNYSGFVPPSKEMVDRTTCQPLEAPSV